MRLINTQTLELLGPFLTTDVPSYAILSHTWGSEELCHQDMANISQHKHKKGHAKLKRFCDLALSEGYRHAWVDTVCIDKTSSAELSEAINSMYRWYKKSAVCYVFLEELQTDKKATSLNDLEGCKWFTRGWTLQELIAPETVIFYNAHGAEVGTKKDAKFGSHITQLTKVDSGTLMGLSVKRLSVAQRMSWAAQRQTSRPEDIAYSLLGLFGISMPLLYGEGEKAFIRLQEEILRNTDDHTIFAWSTDAATRSVKTKYWGLLAPSPAYFKGAGSLIPVRGYDNGTDYTLTSRGIHLKAWTNETCTRLVLNCCPRNTTQVLCMIPITRLRLGPNDFARMDQPDGPSLVSFRAVQEMSKKSEIYIRTNIHEEDFAEEYLVDYLRITELPRRHCGYKLANWFPTGRFDPLSRTIQTSPFPYSPCGIALAFKATALDQRDFVVTIHTTGSPGEEDSISRDVVGVYHTNESAESFYTEYCKDFLHEERPGDIPGALTLIAHDGRAVWALDDRTFVRVAVNRDRHVNLGSMALGNITVGSLLQGNTPTNSI